MIVPEKHIQRNEQNSDRLWTMTGPVSDLLREYLLQVLRLLIVTGKTEPGISSGENSTHYCYTFFHQNAKYSRVNLQVGSNYNVWIIVDKCPL